MRWSRRRILCAGGALAGMSAAGLLAGPARSREAAADHGGAARRIALSNLHTNERLDIEYFRDGAYRAEALSAIEVLLRDFRTGERHPIDPKLMDYLVEVARAAGADPAFSVISGYRSPQTNAQLRERSTGVAQRSLHMEGRAIDVRISGVDCASLAAHAEDLKRGGVGYYRGSDFVHMDTGAFRTWKG
ncbi:MAG TPA: DUF882 domain-containing protein [Steroidobacteraceae bacterium]|jgi:uncharacterized protein YcbK (DUF882 family)|nr:DUF882 domain-containing protein [Steroidobacteraceae bacterium]